jgi:hypothetical protein
MKTGLFIYGFFSQIIYAKKTDGGSHASKKLVLIVYWETTNPQQTMNINPFLLLRHLVQWRQYTGIRD